MQRNKYLEDLGLSIDEYGTNFVSDEDDRNGKWKIQREEYGFDSRECWNLDVTFIEWLYSHLMMYKEDAVGDIDMTYHKFLFDGNQYTHEECIDYILERLKAALLQNFHEYNYNEVRDAIRMWAEIYSACWW